MAYVSHRAGHSARCAPLGMAFLSNGLGGGGGGGQNERGRHPRLPGTRSTDLPSHAGGGGAQLKRRPPTHQPTHTRENPRGKYSPSPYNHPPTLAPPPPPGSHQEEVPTILNGAGTPPHPPNSRAANLLGFATPPPPPRGSLCYCTCAQEATSTKSAGR